MNYYKITAKKHIDTLSVQYGYQIFFDSSYFKKWDIVMVCINWRTAPSVW